MEEHVDTVAAAQPCLRRGLDEVDGPGAVAHVGDRTRRLQACGSERHGGQPRRRGVDDDVGGGNQAFEVVLVPQRHSDVSGGIAGLEPVEERARCVDASRHHCGAFHRDTAQCEHHRPCHTAGPHHQGASAGDRPQSAATQGQLEARRIGVVTDQAAVVGHGDGVDRAGERGITLKVVAGGGQRELVRRRDVGAAPSTRSQVVQDAGQLRRRHADELVGAVAPARAQRRLLHRPAGG